MSLRFLLDTNVVSEPLRPQPHPNVMKLLPQHQDEIAIATVVWHELLFGCRRLPDSQRRRKIEKYLKEEVEPKIPFLPYDTRAATWHAGERARLTSIGKPPSLPDGQIAAIASTNNLIVVTNNVSDYANFNNLQLENWFLQ